MTTGHGEVMLTRCRAQVVPKEIPVVVWLNWTEVGETKAAVTTNWAEIQAVMMVAMTIGVSMTTLGSMAEPTAIATGGGRMSGRRTGSTRTRPRASRRCSPRGGTGPVAGGARLSNGHDDEDGDG